MEQIRVQAYFELLEIIKTKGGRLISPFTKQRDLHIVECSQGHQWSVRPYNIKGGKWCPKCANKDISQSIERLHAVVRERNGEIIGTYVNDATKILFKCKLGHEFYCKPNHIKANHWCRKCAGNDKELAAQKLQSIVSKNSGLLLTPYTRNHEKVLIQCQYGHRWMPKASDVIRNHWCIVCNQSRGEREITYTLQQLGVEFTPQYTHYLIPKAKYDFYFKYQDMHFLLEYDGIQHFQFKDYFYSSESELEHRHNIDRNKSIMAITTGFKLIRIDYTQIEYIMQHIIWNRTL